MKRISLLIVMVLSLALVVACDSGKPTGEAKKEGATTALSAPAGSAGRMENDEGIGHYQQSHWDVAESHFRKAVQTDPNLAEAHFNLALALDKMGKHEDAKAEFKKAADLASNKPEIKDSPILKQHLGM